MVVTPSEFVPVAHTEVLVAETVDVVPEEDEVVAANTPKMQNSKK